MSERSHRCRAACIEMKPGPYLGDGFWDQPPPLPKIFDIELSREKQALQNIQNDCYEGLSDSCRVHQIRFLPGLRPGPAGGAHDASPDPLVGWGGGHPSPFPTPSTHSATRHRRLRRLVPKIPSEFFFWIRPWMKRLHESNRYQNVICYRSPPLFWGGGQVSTDLNEFCILLPPSLNHSCLCQF